MPPHDRREHADAGPLPPARPARRDDREPAPDACGGRAHHLAGPARRTDREAARCLLAHPGHHRRLGLPARPHGGLRQAGHAGLPRLGHDGDLPLGTVSAPAGRSGRHGSGVRVPADAGPFPGERRGPPLRSRRRAAALGRGVGGRVGGAGPVDRRRLLQRPGRRTPAPRRQVQRGRLAQDG